MIFHRRDLAPSYEKKTKKRSDRKLETNNVEVLYIVDPKILTKTKRSLIILPAVLIFRALPSSQSQPQRSQGQQQEQ